MRFVFSALAVFALSTAALASTKVCFWTSGNSGSKEDRALIGATVKLLKVKP